MSHFEHAEAIVAQAKADPGLRDLVAKMRAQRYAADAAKFDHLLWLLLANGACFGARLVLAEMQEERAK